MRRFPFDDLLYVLAVDIFGKILGREMNNRQPRGEGKAEFPIQRAKKKDIPLLLV